MLVNRSITSSTLIPQLPYAGVAEAAEWLHAVFGFTVRLRIGAHRIQMNAGDGHVVPTRNNGKALHCSVMMRVADVDAHYARVAGLGIAIAAPPETHVYGERQYSLADCGGHIWTFSQSVADVAPKEWGGLA